MIQSLYLFSLVYVFLSLSCFIFFLFSLGLEDLDGSPLVKGRIFLTCLLTFEYSPEDFPLLQLCPLRVKLEKNILQLSQFLTPVLPGSTYFMLTISVIVLELFPARMSCARYNLC